MMTYPCFKQNIGEALSHITIRISDDTEGLDAGFQIFDTRKQLINFFILQKLSKWTHYNRQIKQNRTQELGAINWRSKGKKKSKSPSHQMADYQQKQFSYGHNEEFLPLSSSFEAGMPYQLGYDALQSEHPQYIKTYYL